MAQLTWNLPGGGTTTAGDDDVDEVENPEAGLTGGDEDSTDTGSITIGANSDGWESVNFDDDSDSQTNESGVDEVRDPEGQLRHESGLDEDSTGTGSAIVTSGGASDAGAVTVDPTRDSDDATEENDDFMETVDRVTESVTRERNQDNRDDNDVPIGGGGPGSDESGGDSTGSAGGSDLPTGAVAGLALLGLLLLGGGS
jgi:hypothetical protein